MTIAPLSSALSSPPSPNMASRLIRAARTPTSTTFRRAIFAGGGAFDLLVGDSGQVVGSVGLCRVSGSACELRKMYLALAVRGCGRGRQLLEHALARAAELGFRRVVLETASVLRAAIALYERYGFRRYTPDHLAARCDAAYYLDLQPNEVA